MSQRNAIPWTATTLVVGVCLALVTLAMLRIHLRVQTTMIGYEIGHLKASEARLIETRNTLKMQLAKMTTQKHLQRIIQVNAPKGAPEGIFALK
ncbi:MAG: hypothetical protein RL011_1695 [Pseudomonadota bacterium]